MSTVEAWHFLHEDGCLKYQRHTKVKVEVGQTLVFNGTPVLCQQGYHASVRAIDALSYAPGNIVCRVRMGGTIVRGADKLVATERTVLWMADATNTLHECACLFAEEALRAAKVDDPRCHAAIDAKRKWLRGEITDAELKVARDAAWGAASAAAWDTAWDAAWDAASAAASATARGSARYAASAARDAQNIILERELAKLEVG